LFERGEDNHELSLHGLGGKYRASLVLVNFTSVFQEAKIMACMWNCQLGRNEKTHGQARDQTASQELGNIQKSRLQLLPRTGNPVEDPASGMQPQQKNHVYRWRGRGWQLHALPGLQCPDALGHSPHTSFSLGTNDTSPLGHHTSISVWLQ
jgi:hypothetical protein